MTAPPQIKHVECDIMTAISFLSRALLTASKTGLVKMWVRPLTLRQRMKHKAPSENRQEGDIAKSRDIVAVEAH
jgi:hypothetical protein